MLTSLQFLWKPIAEANQSKPHQTFRQKYPVYINYLELLKFREQIHWRPLLQSMGCTSEQSEQFIGDPLYFKFIQSKTRKKVKTNTT